MVYAQRVFAAVTSVLTVTLGLVALQPNATAASSSCLSNGTGGAFTDVENQTFTDSRGISSKYHMYGSGLPSTPIGLVVYFHGDGGYAFNSPEDLTGMAKAAKAQKMMLLPLLTPDSKTETWYEQADSNAQWVDSFLANIYKKYNVDRSRIWFVGYSGGSTFLAGYYINPTHMKSVCGGGSIMFGGGEKFGSKGGSFNPAFVKNFRMHWYTGQNDTGSETDGWSALKAAQNGRNAFAKLGFKTTMESPAGVGHNNIPFDKVVQQQLSLGAKPTTAFAPSTASPKLTVSLSQGIVVARGTGFAPGAKVSVSARMAAATGTKQVAAKGGVFTVKFRPPSGFKGLASVSATSGNVSKAASIQVGTTPATASASSGGCVAPKTNNVLLDQDTTDSQLPWERKGQARVTINFETGKVPADYLEYMKFSQSVWNKSPCLNVQLVRSCSGVANCVTVSIAAGTDSDGNFDADEQNGFTVGGHIDLYKDSLDPLGAGAKKNVTTHEMGHAVGLVHRKTKRVLMNEETYKDVFFPDAIDYHNLLVSYGNQKS